MTLNRDFNVTPIGIFDVEYGINSTRLIDIFRPKMDNEQELT